MKFCLKAILFILIITTGTSCATIIGGSKYLAHVKVQEEKDVRIFYRGRLIGKNEGYVKILRRNADQVVLLLKKEGCVDQVQEFKRRSFRVGSFVGTVVGWTGITASGVPLPWGVLADGLTGSWWKPNSKEEGVSKLDYKNYLYTVNYTGCDAMPIEAPTPTPMKDIHSVSEF